jgi:hypothetical protein
MGSVKDFFSALMPLLWRIIPFVAVLEHTVAKPRR